VTSPFGRLELALAALALTASTLVCLVAMDAVQYHAGLLWHGLTHASLEELHTHGQFLLAVALADAVVITRAGRSLARQVREQRSFLRSLPVRSVFELDGELIRVFPGRSLQAFCAGLLRPAVYVSAGTLRRVSGPELRAILAHERHHRIRHDPLRMLIARVVSDAFRPLPALATLADREFSLADLAADAAAVRALGDVQPLASALARFDESAAGGVAPERVDQLLREGPPESVPGWLLLGAGMALAALAAVAVPMLLLGWHPDLTVPVGAELAAVTAACAPSYFAARHAGACLRSAG
jgi:Zn-dependent protease with chaperone function